MLFWILLKLLFFILSKIIELLFWLWMKFEIFCWLILFKSGLSIKLLFCLPLFCWLLITKGLLLLLFSILILFWIFCSKLLRLFFSLFPGVLMNILSSNIWLLKYFWLFIFICLWFPGVLIYFFSSEILFLSLFWLFIKRLFCSLLIL